MEGSAFWALGVKVGGFMRFLLALIIGVIDLLLVVLLRFILCCHVLILMVIVRFIPYFFEEISFRSKMDFLCFVVFEVYFRY